ncbi:MAG: cupredoxin domain-containing protein [Methanoculleus sp.]
MTRLLRLLILTLVIGCVALFSGAVAQEYGGGQTPAVAAVGNETNATNVTITSPLANATVAAGNVTVEVNVTNFTLVEPTGQPNAPGEGHLHYYLDAVVPTNESEPAIPETGGYVISTNLTYTWENVTEGEHNLSVQVVNNDHTPLIPLVFETVNVTVGGENVTPMPTMNVTPAATANVTPTTTMNATPTATGNVTPAPTTGDTVTVNITADALAFDTSTITVPAGANVTVNFDNQDGGIPHNVAVYDSPLRSEQIFVGEVITGPATTTYTFTAPSEPGTYYFQCDVHPSMNGEFIVE